MDDRYTDDTEEMNEDDGEYLRRVDEIVGGRLEGRVEPRISQPLSRVIGDGGE